MTNASPTLRFEAPSAWEPLGATMPSDLDGPRLAVGTRKGLWMLGADRTRARWASRGPVFFGHVVQHAVADPRQPDTILAGLRTVTSTRPSSARPIEVPRSRKPRSRTRVSRR